MTLDNILKCEPNSVGFDMLRVNILRQAKSDYMIALKKRDYYHVNECEEFFLSPWGQSLSLNCGERIISLCRELVEHGKKKD